MVYAVPTAVVESRISPKVGAGVALLPAQDTFGLPVAHQIVKAFADRETPRYRIRDWDGVY
jgi:hypothetical protein